MDDEQIQTLARETAKKHINNLADQLGTGDFEFDAEANTEPPPQNPNMNPNKEQLGKILSQSPTVRCEMCDGCLFDIVYVIKKVPAELSPNKAQTAVPLQVFRCADCKYIGDEMLPDKIMVDVNAAEVINRGYRKGKVKTRKARTKAKK